MIVLYQNDSYFCLFDFRSMYFDEDGDLAHEFYKQVVRGNRLTMERCVDNLRPQVRLLMILMMVIVVVVVVVVMVVVV